MLSLLDADQRTQRASIAHCLRRCMGKLCRRLSRVPSVYIHESLNDDEETPGTLLEHHHAGLEHSSSITVEPAATIVETPADLEDSKDV